jgi:hypothetical protein
VAWLPLALATDLFYRRAFIPLLENQQRPGVRKLQCFALRFPVRKVAWKTLVINSPFLSDLSNIGTAQDI